MYMYMGKMNLQKVLNPSSGFCYSQLFSDPQCRCEEHWLAKLTVDN